MDATSLRVARLEMATVSKEMEELQGMAKEQVSEGEGEAIDTKIKWISPVKPLDKNHFCPWVITGPNYH